MPYEVAPYVGRRFAVFEESPFATPQAHVAKLVKASINITQSTLLLVSSCHCFSPGVQRRGHRSFRHIASPSVTGRRTTCQLSESTRASRAEPAPSIPSLPPKPVIRMTSFFVGNHQNGPGPVPPRIPQNFFVQQPPSRSRTTPPKVYVGPILCF